MLVSTVIFSVYDLSMMYKVIVRFCRKKVKLGAGPPPQWEGLRISQSERKVEDWLWMNSRRSGLDWDKG